LDLSGSFENPVLGGYLSLNNGFINFNSNNKNNKLDKNIKEIGFFTNGEPSIEFKDNDKNDLLNNSSFKHF